MGIMETEGDGFFGENDENVWDGPFWTTEVHRHSEDKFITQTAKLSGTTVSYPKRVWVLSYWMTAIIGAFVTAMILIAGFLIGGGAGALLVLLGIILLIALGYNLALFRWSLKRKSRSL